VIDGSPPSGPGTSLPMRRQLLLGLVALLTVATGVAHYAGAPAVPTFAVAAFALAGLAWIVSFATEQVGEHFGPAATGVLQSTLGNLPELFVVVFALAEGELVVAQFSILGSIFANALLVLGAVIVVGARASRDECMRFGPRLPNDTATLLLLASFIIVLVALSDATHDNASAHIGTISAIASALLLGVYGVWVVGYVRSQSRLERQERRAHAALHGEPAPLAPTIALLALAGAGAAFVSDWFIAALRPTIDALGISEQFAGLVIVAIAGNAVENVAGVVLAAKGQSDLAISVVKNSVAQVAAFLFPLLVLISLAFAHQLTFGIPPLYVGALLLTAISIWQITSDGSATAFEGWALMATYAVLAVFTLYE
jgi:Ca2+:H+ antiporter